MLVYAYERGGATTAGIVAVVQLVPAAIFGPLTSVLADRQAPARVLAWGYVAQACAMGATAAVLLAGGPPVLAYALAAVAATTVTITRPTQAALVPALARSPEELTATNVVSGWIESASVLVAPAIAGVLLDVSSAGTVFATMAVVAAGSAATVRGVRGPSAAASRDDVSVAAGLVELAREPAARSLAALLTAQFVAIGALDVLYVVLALSTLDLGDGGAGYLNAAFGAGGVAAVLSTATLVGRARLVPALAIALGVWTVAFVVLAAAPTVAGAVLLLAVAGAARSLLDVAGRTLLQRAVRADRLARVFGVVEGLSMAALAVGSLLTPAFVALGGVSAALLALAAFLPLVALASGKWLLASDRAATVPIVEIGLVRTHRLFTSLDPPTIERLARALVPVDVAAGETLIREGAAGDRFYLVADGELDVTHDGTQLRRLRRGDGAGELALLFDIPRTATVIARTDVHAYALAREPFLAAVAPPGRGRQRPQLAGDAAAGVTIAS
jgi:Cyclic nucleotide-binding domain/Major Facilitator Superfamily